MITTTILADIKEVGIIIIVKFKMLLYTISFIEYAVIVMNLHAVFV